MKRINFLAVALAAGAAPLFIVLSAKADLAQLNDGAPVVVIKSTGGQITVRPSEADGLVRIPGNAAGVQMNRFNVNQQTMGHVAVPCTQAFRAGLRGGRPCNRPIFNVPNLREGPHGVAITNPGNDLAVGVPQRFEAMFITAGASPVLVEQTRGPYVIVGENDVTLHGVTGPGWVRTTAGTVNVRNPSRAIRIETGAGHVIMQSGPALERAEIFSQSGDIDWTVSGVGSGPYRVMAGQGVVRILLRPGVGANIDAVSDSGTVVNYLDSSAADVRLLKPHALSLTVGGGGAQITVHSVSGTVVIAPAQ